MLCEIKIKYALLLYFKQSTATNSSANLIFICFMQAINFRKFKIRFAEKRKTLRRFISHTENKPPHNLESLAEQTDKVVWEKVNCLSCANCCKVMSPTYTFRDIKRIAAHLGMRPKDFRKKWLYRDKRENDWMNKSTPCQFLDVQSNMCSIYEVRPADCASFPHLIKKPITDYMYVHKQNIGYCPATLLFVEKLYEAMNG
jgi:Fe-S-cluster containining protein